MNPDELYTHKPHSKTGNNKRKKELKMKNIKQNGGRSAKATAVRSVFNERFKLYRAAQFYLTTSRVPQLEINAKIPPPDVVAVMGPPGSGKTQLVKQLIKYYTGASVDPIGPVTVSAGKYKRITLLDVPAELSAVLDAARVADLVVICINAANGIETEIFEFLNVLQAIGFPKVFTCVTHYDGFARVSLKLKNNKKLRERIYKEIYQGSKVFFLDWSGSYYKQDQLATMGRCISQQNYGIPLSWRSYHGFVLVDRVERHVNNTVTGFGFVQGYFINTHYVFHIPGYGDVHPYNFELLDDPAVPNQKLSLYKDKPVVYGPMSAINDVKIDDQGVHVRINVKHTPGKAGKAEKAILDGLKYSAPTERARGLHLFEDDADALRVDEPEEEDFAHEDVADKETSSEADNLCNEYENAAENYIYYPADASFESTASNLDMCEVEEETFQVEEETEELPDAREDNEDERVNIHLRRLRLKKAHASQQFYNDLIYSYYKQGKDGDAKKEDSKQKTRNLFGEETKDESVDVTGFPKSYYSEYRRACDGLSSKVVPSSFQVAAKQGRGTQIDIRLSSYTAHAFITSDVDFSTALDRCLNGSAGEDQEGEQPAGGPLGNSTVGGAGAYNGKNAANAAKNAPSTQKNEYAVDGSYYNGLLAQISKAKQREALLNPQLTLHETRFAPGAYVKFTFEAIPDFALKYDPRQLLVLGALLPNEVQKQLVTARVKRHRWFPKVLKSRNPLIFAIGWRRFQSLPAYAAEDENDVGNVDSTARTEQMRLRMLKYTPEFTHCACVFWGYGAPPGTGIIAFQDIKARGWRVAATGGVVESSDSHNIYKKLKLVGYPEKTAGKTVFIKDMFSSKHEAAAFAGSELSTVSGNRGILKSADDSGLARAKFEEYVRMSDVIFLKTWVKIKVDRVVIDYDNLLSDFYGVRTVAEIRRDRNLPIQFKQDSYYVREQKEIFVQPELIVNYKLLKYLPFDKQKQFFSAQESRRLQIKDKFMRTLVKGKREAQREEIVYLAAKVQEKNESERRAYEQLKESNQQKWKDGMERRRNAIRDERKAAERKRKRAILGRRQESVLKRGKI